MGLLPGRKGYLVRCRHSDGGLQGIGLLYFGAAIYSVLHVSPPWVLVMFPAVFPAIAVPGDSDTFW